MAKDLNKVMIIGRLGKDPEMRYTPGGSPVTTFSVAAGRQWKDSNGELHEETEWFNVVTRLQTRQWQDQEGLSHYRTEVIASDMIMLDGRSSREHSHYDDHHQEQRSPRTQAGREQRDIGDEDIPF
jgi:single-strand DNA-binding protein